MNRFATNLRIPGPTSLPDPVREAGGRQMINHRGPEFSEMLRRIAARLQPFFGTTGDVLLLTASGTGGLEAAIVNLLSPGDRVLSICIGAFGERFAAIASTYGADVTRHDVEWGQAMEPDALRALLRADNAYTAVLITHNETSTGVTNPLRELAAIVHEEAPDALVIVDAISGLGAVPFEMDGWGLDVVVTGSQKTWMAAPGVSMIALSERAWKASEGARMPRFYFDLAAAREFAVKGQTPATPAVAVLFQLDVALGMLTDEGLDAVFARHAAVAAATRAGLEALGFRLAADPRYASNTVTCAWLPEGVEWKPLDAALVERGLVVAGGQGKLSGKTLRVGHLGDVSIEAILAVMSVLEAAFIVLGRQVTPGAAVAAAERAGLEAMQAGASGASAAPATAGATSR